MNIGIDCFAFDLPKIHLPITTLAEARGIEPAKLVNGLGLHKMAFLDVHQDVVTLAANAAIKLIQDNHINTSEVARIYVGTESGVDSSKPIASYVMGLLESQLGARSFANCDATDITFACIGAVDALQNALDYVRLYPHKKVVVIATDNAKYDLASTGEYTQGAGAIAMLVTSNPRILTFEGAFGTATESVFDFFKPRRVVEKSAITGTGENAPWFDVLETELSLYKEQPVFDGQYSNQCYIDRIKEAYDHFKSENKKGDTIVFEEWKAILMHLPYCYQGRRTFHEIYAQAYPEKLDSNLESKKDQLKALAKSADYMQLVQEKIAPSEIASGQVGNIYTGSIFLGLLSTLSHFAQLDEEISGSTIGFIAYGSGSKSKVFEARVQPKWKSPIKEINLFGYLEKSTPITLEAYEALHKKESKISIQDPEKEFVINYIEKENPNLLGARYYKFVK